MSSRNRRLDASHRAEAAALFRGLSAANDSFNEGNKNSRKLVSVFEEALQWNFIEPSIRRDTRSKKPG